MRPLTSLGLLALGTLLAYLGTTRRRFEVVGAGLAAAGVVAWLMTNGAYEGAVLLSLTPDNGLTAGDLLAVPAAALLGVLTWRSVRR